MQHYYYGDGKGKTSAAVGAAVRFAGSGGNVLFYQFLKGKESNERKILEKITNICVLEVPVYTKFLFRMTPEERQELSLFYKEKLRELQTLIKKEDFGMVVLDEAGDLIDGMLMEPGEFMQWLEQIKQMGEREIVLTGHQPVKVLIDSSDYVTCMKKGRHPFDMGQQAREGIEY